MKTTKQWLEEVKADPAKLTHWLKRQYIGECLAADRIELLARSVDTKYKPVLMKIAKDEQTHANWVCELLVARNIKIPEVSIKDTRYWEPILSNLQSFEEIAGAGHHAETMRLIRIRALAADTEIATDIRTVFANILPDEEMHAKAFAAMSTKSAIESTKELHKQGLDMLGLEA